MSDETTSAAPAPRALCQSNTHDGPALALAETFQQWDPRRGWVERRYCLFCALAREPKWAKA